MDKSIKLRARFGSRLLIAALLGSCAIPGVAMAQQEPPTSVDTVVLTAERREQNVQTVPISATVLSGESIARQGVDTVNDLQQVAPSVAINTFNRSVFINIRGVGIAQSAPTSNPGVAYYIDGQLIPHEQFIGQSFFDLESIEVLRGPQGTLTGQNSTGGAIYVRTPAPVYGETFGKLDVTGGSYGQFRGVGAFNLGLGDNAALRFAITEDRRDGFTRNIGPSPSRPGNAKLQAARINLALRTDSDRLQGNLRLEGFDLQTDNNAVKRRNDLISTDPFVIEEDAISYMNQKGYRFSGEVRYDVTDGIRLRGLSSWQDGYTRDQTDGDRTDFQPPRPPSGNVGRVSKADTDFRTATNEINLLSTDDGPLQWVVGAFSMFETVPVTLLRDNNHTVDYVAPNSTTIATALNDSRSIFGQANWRATPDLELIAGLRRSEDEQTYTRYAVTTVLGTPVTGVQTSAETTGRVGANYHFNDSGMVYLTASRGYKAGGVNLTPATPNFLPETNLVYEAGVKVQILDNRLRINGSVFSSDYSDIQLSSLVGGLPVTQNATSGEATGAELELTGRFDRLGFNVGVGYLNARFSNSACISDTNSPGTDAGCATNLRLVPQGRALPFSPEWTASAGLQYDIKVGDIFVTPRLQVSYMSSQNATPFLSANTLVPARTVFDLRVTADIREDLTLAFFVENLTNEVYIASQIQNSSSADGGMIYGAPRTGGIRLVKTFGK